MLSALHKLSIPHAIRKRSVLRWVTSNIRTHTTESERNVLYQLAVETRHPRVIVEIGSYVGASTVCLAAGLKEGGGGQVYCIDTWGNETMPEGQRDTMGEFCANTASYSKLLIRIRKRSEELEISDIPEMVGLAFIDGDHGYAAVKCDIEKLQPRLAENAVVAFHDSKYFPGVSKAIGECLASTKWQLIGAVDNLAWLRYVPSGETSFGVDLAGNRL